MNDLKKEAVDFLAKTIDEIIAEGPVTGKTIVKVSNTIFSWAKEDSRFHIHHRRLMYKQVRIEIEENPDA